MKTIAGGIVAPLGFKASGMHAGIKKSKRKDLMLLLSDELCNIAGVFTTNPIKASCVNYNLKILKGKCAQGLVVNSGNANCLTGASGIKHTAAMVKQTAKALHIKSNHVLVASTGVIGQPLPMDNVLSGIDKLPKKMNRLAKSNVAAAEAILTTDTVIKHKAIEIKIGGKPVRLGVISKGSGMIHPDMTEDGKKHATMLCFISTDANITQGVLQKALNEATHQSFNHITVDADQSTNDMTLMMANGLAKNRNIATKGKDYDVFQQALNELCLYSAKAIVRDGEGATKFVEVKIEGSRSDKDARKTALGIASSSLVKTALFGGDPNWGRIASAAACSTAHMKPDKMRVYLGPYCVLRGDTPQKQKVSDLNRVFKKKDITITVHMGIGQSQATVWTSDLSTQYVRINADYRT